MTPYEEIEQLAELLPDEGESIFVQRKDGRLHVHPAIVDDMRGQPDDQLMQSIVAANLKLMQFDLCLWVSIAIGVIITHVSAGKLLGIQDTSDSLLLALAASATFIAACSLSPYAATAYFRRFIAPDLRPHRRRLEISAESMRQIIASQRGLLALNQMLSRHPTELDGPKPV